MTDDLIKRLSEGKGPDVKLDRDIIELLIPKWFKDYDLCPVTDSLDACRALQAEVLPDEDLFEVAINKFPLGVAVDLSFRKATGQGRHKNSIERAWLIAILRAVASREEPQQ